MLLTWQLNSERRLEPSSINRGFAGNFLLYLIAGLISFSYLTPLVFSIPKIIRRHFLYDRKLPSELSRCAWETLKEFFREVVPEEDAVPEAVIAIHSFGDFLGWHPHLHILCTDSYFYGNGMIHVAPLFGLKHL
jgi:hypothetical protein